MTTDSNAIDASNKTVLIVEDETGLAELYRMWLSEFYEVRIAYSADEALEKFDDTIDVILLDRRMPGMSGDVLLKRIRELNFTGQIAMVSGVEPDTDIADLEIDEYIKKPVSRDRFQSAVESLLVRTRGDATKQELLGLISRKVTLEKGLRPDELGKSQKYQQLVDDIERLVDEEKFSIQSIGSKYRPDSCPSCDLRWDVTVDDTTGFQKLSSRVYECSRCENVLYYSDPSHRRVM